MGGKNPGMHLLYRTLWIKFHDLEIFYFRERIIIIFFESWIINKE